MNNIKLTDLILLDLGEPEIKFAKECLELLETQRVSESNLCVGGELVDFDMATFIGSIFNECGTSCCIAGLHMLNNKSYSADYTYYFGIEDYLGLVGITERFISPLYDFALSESWDNSIDFAIIRLEFIVKYGKVIDIESVDVLSGCQILVASDSLHDTYSRYYISQYEFHEILKRLLND